VNVDSVTGKVFWVIQAGDLPFVGMNTDGCSFTTCPIVAGTRQSYVYQLSISKKFPVVSGGVRL
jgi:Niemann-Pick C2 protein